MRGNVLGLPRPCVRPKQARSKHQRCEAASQRANLTVHSRFNTQLHRGFVVRARGAILNTPARSGVEGLLKRLYRECDICG
ncbi:hypothetical protein AOLI_G00185090 [Acnodon oligacanthus]